MKAKQFNFAVYSAGRTVNGSFTCNTAIDVKRMTQMAVWRAQHVAHKKGWEFDLANFSMAVQPTYEN
jgi:hypothetical protein